MAGDSYVITSLANISTCTAYGSKRRLVRDSSGNLHAVWRDDRGVTEATYYAKSTDGGQTWGSEAKISSDGVAYTACIAVDSYGHIHVVWYEYMDRGDGIYRYRARYRKYTTGWGSIFDIAVADNDYYRHPVIAIDDNDVVHVVWVGSDWHDEDCHVWYRKYTDSWQPAVKILDGIPDQGNAGPSLAVDSQGDLHVAWIGEVGGIGQIRYRKQTSGIWGAIQDLTNDVNDQYHPCIAIDSNDNLHITWYDIADVAIRYIKYDGSWSAIVELASGQRPTVAIDRSDVVYVIYVNTTGNHSIRMRKNDGAWQAEEIIIPVGANVIDHPIAMWARHPQHQMVPVSGPGLFVYTSSNDPYIYVPSDVSYGIASVGGNPTSAKLVAGKLI